MILDQNLRFDPAGTAITATAASTNTIDALAGRDLGVGGTPGQDFLALITIGTAFAAAGAATLQVQLQASVDNANWTTESQTDAIPKANLTAGAVIKLPLGQQQPQSGSATPTVSSIPRYYRLNYVVATGPFTAGTVTADLASGGVQEHPISPAGYQSGYPSGFTVTN